MRRSRRRKPVTSLLRVLKCGEWIGRTKPKKPSPCLSGMKPSYLPQNVCEAYLKRIAAEDAPWTADGVADHGYAGRDRWIAQWSRNKRFDDLRSRYETVLRWPEIRDDRALRRRYQAPRPLEQKVDDHETRLTRVEERNVNARAEMTPDASTANFQPALWGFCTGADTRND
jgi:hypothetical protein